jgi:dihydroxy-acid dehydratase
MIRVLAPESPKIVDRDSAWFETHGVAGLFAHLGDTLHDTRTLTGQLKGGLPISPPPPEGTGSRLIFIRGRASGTEVVCRTDDGRSEVYGECRLFASEEHAVRAVEEGAIEPSDLLVVVGFGPRGGPGLLRLDRLGDALAESRLDVPVLTDGLPPEDASGVWASLITPEAAEGGVIARLRDGDSLRLDLAEGVIRTGVVAEEIRRREPFMAPVLSGMGYAARYARSALPPLEGAGFA